MIESEPVNILVVDDVPSKLLSIKVVLEELGEHVVGVPSGRAALGALLERDFAVILLDVNMPDMDGFETASLIRQRARAVHTPIIFLTAYSDEHFIGQGYSLGAVDYILTPFNPEVLRAKVSVFVDLYRKTEQIKQHARHEIELAREQAARAVAEEASRRAEFLAAASTALTRSLNLSDTLTSALQTPIPFLGDASLLLLAGSEGEEDRIWECGERDQALIAVEQDQLSACFRAALASSLSQGRSVQFEDEQPLLTPSPTRPSLKHATVSPLMVSGRTLGALCILRGTDRGRCQNTDFSLAEELSNRVALAIDNARLYSEIQEGDRRKEEFLAMLSHELRNPLGAIANALSLLSLEMSDGGSRAISDEEHAAQEVMQRQVRQMERLVEDLLDLSRITRGKIQLRQEPVELQNVIERAAATVDPYLQSRRHLLQVDVPAAPALVLGDVARLEQVVVNLLNNAAKYMEPEGRVLLKLTCDKQHVELTVTDAGIGIQRDMLTKVFDLFVQGDRALDRSQGGLGIGLTLVRSLIKLHGGEVYAESPGLNQGTSIVLRLPSLKVPVASSGAPEEGFEVAATGEAGRRILVVDDNADLLAMMALLLKRVGHEVHQAMDGHAALEIAERVQPEVVLIDIGLPGMSGYDVARRLRATPTMCPVVLIAMTGYGQPEDRRKTREAGFDHHLVKPVAFQQLQELLRPAILPAEASL